MGEKRLQDRDGDGRLPGCRERIYTVGCCFASIMQITCTRCAIFSWVCCCGRGRLAAPHAAVAAATIKGNYVLPTALLTPSAVSTQTHMQMNRTALMSAELERKQHTHKKTLKGEGEIGLCLVKTCSSKSFPSTPDSPETHPLTHHFQVAVAGQSKSKDPHLSGSKCGNGGVNDHLSVLPALFNNFCCISCLVLAQLPKERRLVLS